MVITLIATSLAANFKVDATHDAPDLTPGDGVCAAAMLSKRTGTPCTLRAAVEESNALPGADQVNLDALSYAVSLGELTVLEDLTVAGQGANATFVDGTASIDGLFHVVTGTLSVTELTLHGAYREQGGLIAVDMGQGLEVGDSHFEDGTAMQGGAIYVAGLASVSIEDSSFDDNHAVGGLADPLNSGGAMYSSSAVSVEHSSFQGNSGFYGGALALINGGTLQTIEVVDNSAGNYGGGVWANQGLYIDDSIIKANDAVWRGGGVSANTGAITNSWINDNESDDDAGGVYAGGALSISQTTIAGNYAGGDGGGVYGASLSHCAVTDNQAVGDGGGLFDSGAVYDTTISGNQAGGDGGGLRSVWPATTLINVTVADNMARGSGGGMSAPAAYPPSTGNTVFEKNSAPTGPDCDLEFMSLGGTMVSQTSGCSVSFGPGDQVPGTAALGALVSTGAPGSEHHPLGATSSASDAGEASLCSADDQLLVPRATCSIGSVEP